jgi:hypothetical protein
LTSAKKNNSIAPPMKMLPLYDVKYLMINRSESLLSGNIESRKVRHAIKKGYE